MQIAENLSWHKPWHQVAKSYGRPSYCASCCRAIIVTCIASSQYCWWPKCSEHGFCRGLSLSIAIANRAESCLLPHVDSDHDEEDDIDEPDAEE